jgi:hypothetical protein
MIAIREGAMDIPDQVAAKTRADEITGADGGHRKAPSQRSKNEASRSNVVDQRERTSAEYLAAMEKSLWELAKAHTKKKGYPCDAWLASQCEYDRNMILVAIHQNPASTLGDDQVAPRELAAGDQEALRQFINKKITAAQKADGILLDGKLSSIHTRIQAQCLPITFSSPPSTVSA